MLEKIKIILFGNQPVTKISEGAFIKLIAREFPNHTDLVSKKLDLIQSDSSAGKKRIATSVLKLANQDFDKIDQLIDKANKDFRDIVSLAEYPRNSRNRLGEKSKKELKEEYLQDWNEYSAWLNKTTAQHNC